jgi:hypothetical protein
MDRVRFKTKVALVIEAELVGERPPHCAFCGGINGIRLHEMLRHYGKGSKYSGCSEVFINPYTCALVCDRCNTSHQNMPSFERQVELRKAQLPIEKRHLVDKAIAAWVSPKLLRVRA